MAVRSFDLVRSTSFMGSGAKLQDLDIPRIGHLIGVGEDELHAVIEVETRSGGFNALKQPKILFEPHIFYKHLTGNARDRAVMGGLAYAKWKAGAYGSESEQYPKLIRALAIDETAALKACSWGMGQVLGENYVAAGFPTVQAMVCSAVDGGEAAHLEMMVNFIKNNHLDDELRNHNWAAFARGYNGPQYAKNAYDTKLKNAFAKWQKISDTPWLPSISIPTVIVPQAVVVAQNKNRVNDVVVVKLDTPIISKESAWSRLGTKLTSMFNRI